MFMDSKIAFLGIAVLLCVVFLLNNTSGIVYDVCEAMSDEKVSYDDFQALIEAIYNGDCNEAMNVKTTFSMSHDDFSELAYTYEIVDTDGNPLVFYRTGAPSPIGAGAILVYGNDGDFPVKMGDYLQIWTSGSPRDIIIEVGMGGCDPYDDKCDAMCSYEEEHVCDPLCYVNNTRENVQCDIDCVDVNNNRVIDEGDLDGICDLDCYNDDLDPKRAYDPDCVDVDNTDGICDPDSQGVKDGRCDPDCAPANHHCDFDCNATTYPGNPSGLNDTDCYECDGICNGFCSFDCTYLDKDPDCPAGFTDWFDLTECCGNAKCGIGENCETCEADCPTEGNCSDLNVGVDDHFFCCPDAVNADMSGCANLTTGKLEGDNCTCAPECSDLPDKLLCTGPTGDKHCCPAGEVWNGTECKLGGDVLIVALKANLESVYNAGQITSLEVKIDDFIEALAVDGLGGSFFYLDDEDMMDDVSPDGWVTDPSSWTDIDKILDGLIPKMKSKYLIIIGGDANFPQTHIVSQPGPMSYKSESDDPYGDIDGDPDYMPDIAVGRMPAPNNGDIDVILNTLDTAINLHKTGGIVLNSHASPIMASSTYGCGAGPDKRDWTSGRCSCTDIWGDSPCDGICGNLDISKASGKDFVIVLAHGPGPMSWDSLSGGSVNANAGTFNSLDVSDALWMSMACGGGHLALKSTTSNSIAMTYLKNGGAVFLGSSDNNYGALASCGPSPYTCCGNGLESLSCPATCASCCGVPGGDCCIGSIYTEVATRFSVGTRIGNAFMEGKNAYFGYPSSQGCSCPIGHPYQYHVNYLMGDPTLKIKSKW